MIVDLVVLTVIAISDGNIMEGVIGGVTTTLVGVSTLFLFWMLILSYYVHHPDKLLDRMENHG